MKAMRLLDDWHYGEDVGDVVKSDGGYRQDFEHIFDHILTQVTHER